MKPIHTHIKVFLGIALLATMQVAAYSPKDTVIAFDIHDVLIKGKKPDSATTMDDTWKIVAQLKAQGYALYIFSNINEKKLEKLKVKFPDCFILFDAYHAYNKEHQPYIKPETQAYSSFKKFVAQQHAEKGIIFIDDKKENTDKAEEFGIKGIQFQSSKQLQQDLSSILN